MSFYSVLMVKWSPTAILSTWDPWGSHLASFTSTYNLLQPPSCTVERSFSWGDLSCSRWQGGSSPEDFSLSMSSLLSPFLSVLVPTSLCLLLQGFVWPNSAFVHKSLLQKSQHLIHLEIPTWKACIWESVFLSTTSFFSFCVFHPVYAFSLPVHQTNCYVCREGAAGLCTELSWDAPVMPRMFLVNAERCQVLTCLLLTMCSIC